PISWQPRETESLIAGGIRVNAHRTSDQSTTQWGAPAAALAAAAAGSVLIAPPAAAAQHVVVEGDTAFDIAQAFGVPLHDLLVHNGLSAESIIHPGDVFTVPDSGVDEATDTYAGAQEAPTADIAYSVAAGDTLFDIAERHGLTLETLLAANGIDASAIIYPGEVL